MVIKNTSNASIIQAGIMLTLPKQFFADAGYKDIEQFKKVFERYMQRDDALWNFRLTNLPLLKPLYVYLVFGGFVQYGCNFVDFERQVAKEFNDGPDGTTRMFQPSNWVRFTGPARKPVMPIEKTGFQGFRYSPFLF